MTTTIDTTSPEELIKGKPWKFKHGPSAGKWGAVCQEYPPRGSTILIEAPNGKSWPAVVDHVGGNAPKRAGGGYLVHLVEKPKSPAAQDRQLSRDVQDAMTTPVKRESSIPEYLKKDVAIWNRRLVHYGNIDDAIESIIDAIGGRNADLRFGPQTRAGWNIVLDSEGSDTRFAETATEAARQLAS